MSKLPDRDDFSVEVWRRRPAPACDPAGAWDYTVLLPPDVVEAKAAVIRAWLNTQARSFLPESPGRDLTEPDTLPMARVPAMTVETTDAIIRTVALTLRLLATWDDADLTAEAFRELADEVEQRTDPLWDCPLCTQDVCDRGCPLEDVRAQLDHTQDPPGSVPPVGAEARGASGPGAS